jgi:hypothetical protein
MTKSQSITNLARAVLVFRSKVDKIKKDANNPFFKSKYASLPNVLEGIELPLRESGLVFLQFPTNGNGLTTTLIHAESGEFMEDTFETQPVPEYSKEKGPDGTIIWRSEPYVSPQGMGSAITYARRYALASILALNIDHDDDGNAASGKVTDQINGVKINGNVKQEPSITDLPWMNEGTTEYKAAIKKLKEKTTTIAGIKAVRRLSKETEAKLLEASKN